MNTATAKAENISKQTSSLLEKWLLMGSVHYDESKNASLKESQRETHREEAAKCAEKALVIECDNGTCLNLLSRLALDSNKIEEAQAYINDAMASEPSSETIIYSQGHVHLAQGKYIEAKECFRRCVELNPDYFRPKTSYAYTLVAQGHFAEAFILYQKLHREKPEDTHVHAKLVDCSQHLTADYYDENLANNIIEYLSFNNINHNNLGNITASLLIHLFRLDDADAPPIELEAIASNDLLVTALRKIVFSNPLFESLLVSVRHKLLFESIQGQGIDPRFTVLAVSLANNNWLNEYVHAETEDERNLINNIETEIGDILQHQNANSSNIEDLIVLLAMYRPLHKYEYANLLVNSIEKNSPFLKQIIKDTVIRPIEEQLISQTIPCITEIDDVNSLSVQKQYEENPYPRWSHLDYHTEISYARALSTELPHIDIPKSLYSDNIDILIAGCGTGRHALQVAKYFTNTNVTAVDLSQNALAFAKMQAKLYDIKNITFIQADILKLNNITDRFDIIEVSGVLHHMSDPLAGWKVLKSLLKPKGFLKVGLYSELARSAVTPCREKIAESGISSSLEDIQDFRKTLLEKTLQQPDQGLLNSPDFYTTSGCRDLLFNVTEHCFTTLDIADICQQLQMQFLGFIQLPPETYSLYKEQFPNDINMSNLDNWNSFEASHPNTFAAMYQFFCRASE